MTYKSVVITQRGGAEVLKIIENDLRPPAAGDAWINILAVGVCQDDVAARVGNRPILTKPPFVPGHTMLGVVDEIGQGVSQVAVGDRVAALTTTGSQAETSYLAQEKLVCVPAALDPAKP